MYVDKSGLSDDTAPAAKASKPVSPAASVALLFLFLSPSCCGRAAAAGPPSQAKRREGKDASVCCPSCCAAPSVHVCRRRPRVLMTIPLRPFPPPAHFRPALLSNRRLFAVAMGGCLLSAVGSCAEARGEEGVFFFFGFAVSLPLFREPNAKEDDFFSSIGGKYSLFFHPCGSDASRQQWLFALASFRCMANYVRLYPSILSGRDLCYGGDVVRGGIPLSGLVGRGCN